MLRAGFSIPEQCGEHHQEQSTNRVEDLQERLKIALVRYRHRSSKLAVVVAKYRRPMELQDEAVASQSGCKDRGSHRFQNDAEGLLQDQLLDPMVGKDTNRWRDSVDCLVFQSAIQRPVLIYQCLRCLRRQQMVNVLRTNHPIA